MNNMMMNETNESDRVLHQKIKPWYKQFWPWFIISLPASAVIAGVTTVYIAFKYNDSLVVDDYYKAGLAINQVLTRQRAAQELGIRAMMGFNADTSGLSIHIPSGLLSTDKVLRVRLVHATQAEKDRVLLLNRHQQNQFAIQVDDIQDGWWNVFIEPASGKWQINQRIHFPMQGQQLIQPSP